MRRFRGAVTQILGGNQRPDSMPRQRISMPLSDVDGFWHIVDATTGGTREEQFEAHAKRLRQMTGDQLISFYCDYHRMHAQAGTWELWAAAYIINGGCSDDGFDYFRDWLISRGRTVYEAALLDPQALVEAVEKMPDDQDASFEMYGYVPTRVYAKDLNIGEVPIIDWSPISREIKGRPFDEATVESLYPKLAEVARA